MAEVTVFVDDAVLGRLPGVCALDGVPTTSRLTMSEEIGSANRLGILWLLFFAGPLGWIVLFVLASRTSSSERLTVELPYSEGAYERYCQARRLRTNGLAAGVSLIVGLLLLTAWARLGEAGALLILCSLIAAGAVVLTGMWRMSMTSVGVDLDASRRWVTLRRVHPRFAAACQARQVRQPQA